MCSVQDNLGFMWFGTRDGLNRFDGYSFKTYRFSGNNLVHALYIHASGLLLVATEKDIYRYEPKLDSFTVLVSSPYFPIDEIVSDHKGNIWFNANNILCRYSEKTKQVKTYEPQTFFRANGLSVDEDGTLWVGTGAGFLEKYNAANDTFTSFNLFAQSGYHGARYITNVLCTDNEILVGTDKAGLKIFNTKTESYKDVSLCCEKVENLFVRSLQQISPGEFWIGTETGVFVYHSATGQSIKIQKNSSDQYALSDNVVYSICKDKEGGIWVSTYFGGINYYPKQLTPFQRFYYKPFENSLSGNIVREIKRDQSGNLWIGTEDAGLNKFEPKTKRFVHYKPGNNKQNISYIGVHDLLPVGSELWIGTYEHGLDILNVKTGQVVRHYGASPKTGFKSNFPFCLFRTNEDDILVGTTVGIYSYKGEKNFFEPLPSFPPYDLYSCVLKDAQSNIWAGTPGKGVRYVNTRTGAAGNFRFDPLNPKSIASDRVNSIFEDSKKNLWFATENGLCKWNSATRDFKRYGADNGFPSNFLFAMLEDETGQLWISTTKGLVCLDPQRNKTVVYTTANGLLSDQFNFSSAFKDNEGRMYFGSAKGLISFCPSEFRKDSFVPPVYLTGLQIDNQDVAIAQEASPLKQSILFTDRLELNYNQSTFSLSFAALGYTAPQNLEYAYRLEGLSNDWTYQKGARKINFTKLVPGTYVFKVKASSSSGVWNGKETRLTIKVLPPWWVSRSAYTTYIILSLLLIYYLFHSYHRRMEAKNRRKMEQLRIEKEREVLESKIEFFTNVAHEIRTPLTLIMIPLSKALRKIKDNAEVENFLKVVHKHTERLVDLTDQLLDFRQTEIEEFHLSFVWANVSELINNAYQGFAPLAEQNQLRYLLTLPEQPFYANIDVDAFNKIIYNLYSNAIKYANGNVQIELLPLLNNENKFTIVVKNDGFLIPENLSEKIFEPFYRIKETVKKKGTGIGLALSRSLAQLHNGTLFLNKPEDGQNVFVLSLPVVQGIGDDIAGQPQTLPSKKEKVKK